MRGPLEVDFQAISMGCPGCPSTVVLLTKRSRRRRRTPVVAISGDARAMATGARPYRRPLAQQKQSLTEHLVSTSHSETIGSEPAWHRRYVRPLDASVDRSDPKDRPRSNPSGNIFYIMLASLCGTCYNPTPGARPSSRHSRPRSAGKNRSASALYPDSPRGLRIYPPLARVARGL